MMFYSDNKVKHKSDSKYSDIVPNCQKNIRFLLVISECVSLWITSSVVIFNIQTVCRLAVALAWSF